MAGKEITRGQEKMLLGLFKQVLEKEGDLSEVVKEKIPALREFHVALAKRILPLSNLVDSVATVLGTKEAKKAKRIHDVLSDAWLCLMFTSQVIFLQQEELKSMRGREEQAKKDLERLKQELSEARGGLGKAPPARKPVRKSTKSSG